MARKAYSVQFRSTPWSLDRVTEGATITQIAGDLGITDATLSMWVCGPRTIGSGAGEVADDREGHPAGGSEVSRRRDELVSRFQFVADHRDTFE